MCRSLIRRSFALIPALALVAAACGDSKSEKAPPPVAENEASRIVPALDPPGVRVDERSYGLSTCPVWLLVPLPR